MTGNYVQTSAGTLSIDLAGTAAGTSYSQLAVTGSVALAGSLQLALNYTDQPGDNYEIVNQAAGSAVSGTFAGLAEGSQALVGIKAFNVTYLGGTGNDLVLTAAQHDVVTWIGGTSGDWNTGSNWVGGAVPSANEDVIIPAGDTVTISSGAESIDKLTLAGGLVIDAGASLAVASNSTVSGTLALAGGTLQAAGTLTVSGTFNWYDGTLTGTGSTSIASAGTLNVADGSIGSPTGRVLDQALVNAGTVDWTTSRSTTATANGAITNQAGATFKLDGSSGGLAVSGSAATFANAGTFIVSIGSNTFGFALPLTNTGSLSLQSGTLAASAAIANSGTVTVPSGTTLTVTGAAYTQSAGTTNLAGTLSSNQTVSLTGGTLAGTGTVAADLSNGGTVAPGSPLGILTVTGNYTQTSTGTLSIDLAGTTVGTGYSQLDVSGLVTLAGSLQLALNYSPHAGDTYQIVDPPQSVNGTFNGLPEGGQAVVGVKAFNVSYQGDAVSLTSSANDVVTWIGGTSGDWGTASNWTGNAVPGTNDDVIIPAGDTVTISAGAPVDQQPHFVGRATYWAIVQTIPLHR